MADPARDVPRTAPPRPTQPPDVPADAPIGRLVSDASAQLSQLVRDEMRLAEAEMARKGKRLGAGGGLVGGAAALGFITVQALVATVIAALALALPVWAAALITTAVLLAATAALALAGKRDIDKALPPIPERAIDSTKADVAEIKERAHR
ncbi:phage holin family protein [Yinghuangia soli]|uniref:Phage holin family protein n=1 Tax=Yinghuangia soli TaxID=2908204 RepID=A0AA41Q9J7_9ACTN|nr:phage holin family protein [Yinghuangia soli]MCF2533420.1 phage holin family protein [Yinghuangia soli]